MKIRTSNKSGFTLVEIMIVVAIIGLLAAIAIPNFVRARGASQASACVNNLRQIDSAKQQFVLEKGSAFDPADLVEANLTAYLGRGTAGKWPACPTPTGAYTVQGKDVSPTCSIGTTITGLPPHVLPE